MPRFSRGKPERAARDVWAKKMQRRGIDKQRSYRLATAGIKSGSRLRNGRAVLEVADELQEQSEDAGLPMKRRTALRHAKTMVRMSDAERRAFNRILERMRR